MKKSKENSEHYHWGTNCSGWYLVKSEKLSVTEELMPANTTEHKHNYNFSKHYFYILKGTETFEIEKEILEANKGEGIHIYPQVVHRISNDKSSDLEFVLISQTTTRGDRVNEPFEKN